MRSSRRKPKPPVPVARFRVYAHKSTLYYIVQVWATKKDMHANRAANGLPRTECDAHTYSFDEWTKKGGRKTPLVGEMNFYARGLFMEGIAHESTHAIASILRRLRFDFSPMNDDDAKPKRGISSEELVALLIGRFAAQLHFKLRKYKLV
jgi:hypothetical protein